MPVLLSILFGKNKMNQRIKELETEAYKHVDSLISPDDYPTENAYCWNHRVMFNQKFAELIVQECANICFSEADGHRIAFGEHCGIVIKQHFGVEE